MGGYLPPLSKTFACRLISTLSYRGRNRTVLSPRLKPTWLMGGWKENSKIGHLTPIYKGKLLSSSLALHCSRTRWCVWPLVNIPETDRVKHRPRSHFSPPLLS